MPMHQVELAYTADSAMYQMDEGPPDVGQIERGLQHNMSCVSCIWLVRTDSSTGAPVAVTACIM